MAFNPFTNFRKYQKIWMATILLLCMMTFVLCTGTQGDLSELLLNLFRPRGTPYATIDGKKMYGKEFSDLKDQRNVANDYMRAATKEIVHRLDEFLKPENIKKREQNPKEMQELATMQKQRFKLESVLRQPRYFEEGGVKIEDLVDFKVWLAEADRLGVELNQEAVLFITNNELLGNYGQEVRARAAMEVRNNHNRVSEAAIMQALRDEYRVRLAKRALGYGVADYSLTRAALTPAQMWEYYKEKRVEYRISLLPLYVEDFVGSLKQVPNDVELGALFDKGKNQPYDPMSATPGFVLPSRSKVTWVSADPNSEFYKRAAKLALDLQAIQPVRFPQLAGLQIAGSMLARTVAVHEQFENVRHPFRSVSLAEAGADLAIAEYLIRKDPVAVCALIAAGARLDAGIASVPSHVAVGLLRHADAYKAGAREVLRKRAPIYATLAGLGAVHQGLAIPGTWHFLAFKDDHLPVSVIEREVLQILENNQSRAWVQTRMQVLKTKLEGVKEFTTEQVDRVLTLYGKNMGLERIDSKSFYDKYNIADAKELEPLRKSYVAYFGRINEIEGRAIAPEKVLKAGDFWKLFFDGSENFSATGSKNQAMPWPPVVRVQGQLAQQVRMIPDPSLLPDEGLRQIARAAANANPDQPVSVSLFDTAERPFLFWRTADEPTFTPKDLAAVRDRVIEAWKFNKAREEIVLPRAEKIGEVLEKTGTPRLELFNAMEELKKEYQVKREVIPLRDVTPLVPVVSGGQFGGGIQRAYRDFEIPPDLMEYPRSDTAAHLLSLYDLKKPIEIGYPPLDAVNKTLYNEVSKAKEPQGKFVQVLTNQPRTVFFVAVVTDPPEVRHLDFIHATRDAFGHDQLYLRGQSDASKKLREEIIRQLHRDHKVEEPSADIRKSFNGEGA